MTNRAYCIPIGHMQADKYAQYSSSMENTKVATHPQVQASSKIEEKEAKEIKEANKTDTQHKAQQEQKKDTKDTNTKAQESTADTNPLQYKQNIKRNKVVINNIEYYILDIEDVSLYSELKDKYKDDDMTAFIIYMHREFVKDLSSVRTRRKIKNIAKIALYAVLVLIVLLFIAVFAIKVANR